MTDEMTYVYVLGQVNPKGSFMAPSKVGMSRNFHKRANSIKTASPLKVEAVLAVGFPDRRLARIIEATTHEMFAKFRTNGEWFDMCPLNMGIGVCANAREAILQLCDGDKAKAFDLLDWLGVVGMMHRLTVLQERQESKDAGAIH